jgi:hypothetical protein
MRCLVSEVFVLKRGRRELELPALALGIELVGVGRYMGTMFCTSLEETFSNYCVLHPFKFQRSARRSASLHQNAKDAHHCQP